MKLLSKLICVFTVALCSCATTKPVQPTIQTSTGRDIKVAKFEQFVEQKMQQHDIPALSIAIITDSELTYSKNFGVKNSLTKEPVAPDTLFEAASVSKPLFGFFVLQQAEKGVINLDQPVVEYYQDDAIDTQDPNHKLLTARMILNHSSGFVNWRESSDGKSLEDNNKEDKLRFTFKPGTQYGYSGEAYQYLKRALAHQLSLSDIELDQYFRDEISSYFDTSDMAFTWKEEYAKRKAYSHRNGEPTDNNSQGPADWFGSAGSLHTDAKNYAQFLLYLMQHQNPNQNPEQNHSQEQNNNLAQQSLELQRNLPKASNGNYRSLLFPYWEVDGQIRFAHSGNNGDTRAYCHFYKDNPFGIVMFSNTDKFFASQFAKQILGYLDEPYPYH